MRLISNHWKLCLLLFPIIGTCVLASPGGQRGFFQAVWGAYNRFVVTYLTEDLAQDNDMVVVGSVITNFTDYPSFATSSAEFDNPTLESRLYATPAPEIITNNPWTAEVWVNMDAYSTAIDGNRIGFFSLYSGSFQYQCLDYRFSRIQIGLGNSSGQNFYSTGRSLSLNTWYHLALAESQTSRVVYVDGLPVVTNTVTFDFRHTPVYFILGSQQPGAEQFDGTMSEARLWNYARSDQEILDNYNKRMRGDEPGLVGYWPFNEGSL